MAITADRGGALTETCERFARHATMVIVVQGANGAISPAGASGEVTVAYGGDITFAITPEPGYRTVKLIIDGTDVAAAKSYTFFYVKAGHSISAEFAEKAGAAYWRTEEDGRSGAGNYVPIR